MICAAALAVSCTPQEKPAVKPSGTTEKKEENKHQGNLDMLNPSAYSDVSGIRLEPGSYISIIGKTSGTAYWNEVESGAEQAAEDLNKALGYKGNDKIKVNFSGSAKGENIEDQINILDEELARNPIAVGIAIIDSSACEVQFDLAAENGIPIIAFDSGSDYMDIEAMCSANNSEIGRTAAGKLSEAVQDKGAAALFVNDKKSTSARQREEAFLKEIKEKYPEIEVPVIYHMDELNETAKVIAEEKNAVKEEGAEDIAPEDITQTEVIRYFLEKHPEINGCFATNAETVQILLEALSDAGKEDMAVIGVDGGEEQMKALEEGRISGLIVQNPYGMGYASVIAAARAALNMGNQAFVDTSFIWVTKENMEKDSIQKILY